MSGPFGSQHWAYSKGFYPHEIGNSARLNNGDFFSRTPSSSSNADTFTYSAWVKNCPGQLLGGFLLSSGVAGSREFLIYFDGTNQRLNVYQYNGGIEFQVITSMQFRDSSAWYHIVVVYDSPQTTASNRVKIYVNGEQQTNFATANYPAQGLGSRIGTTEVQDIGKNAYNQGLDADFYLAEVNYISGSALPPTSFGETKSGTWIPKKYAGSYGSHDYYLDFATRATNPIDASGQGNNWSSTNVAATDWMLDSPTNNFATLNPIGPRRHGANYATGNQTHGNLTITSKSNSYFDDTAATVFNHGDTGKWYYEIRNDQNHGNGGTGYLQFNIGGTYLWEVYSPATQIVNTPSGSHNVSTFSNGDIFMFAVDQDNGKGWFGKNGSWYTVTGTPDPAAGTNPHSTFSSIDLIGQIQIRSSTSSLHRTVTANFGQDSSFAGQATAQGNTDAHGLGDFYYAPPAGYLALCTANLPDPVATINPAINNSPQDYFNTVLYTGNGSNTRTITGVGFDPDLVWQKSRSTAINHNLIDRLRGAGNNLSSDGAFAEYGAGTNGAMNNVETDGASILAGSSSANNVNQSGQTYVLWNWKAGGSGVSNSDGTTASVVSANTDAGFSIVTYTGTGSAGMTIGHGLSSAPELIIVKNRADGSENWTVYSSSLGNTKKLELNLTGASATTGNWNNTTPSSSVFTLGNVDATNTSGESCVAYCFHSVEGFSKFGTYTGNGSADGTFVYTGFRPAFVMWKNVGASENWYMVDTARDPHNESYHLLRSDLSNAEASGSVDGLDILSNGFKLKVAGGGWINASGNTFLYMAFAEMPFKYANAK